MASSAHAESAFTFFDTGGVLDQRTTSLNKTKTKLTNDQAALIVASRPDRCTDQKYNDMDTLVGKLKATASNITSMFDALTLSRRLKLRKSPAAFFHAPGFGILI
jgi:flagellar capping protein FliD